MKLINVATTSEFELRWGSGRDLAAGLVMPGDLQHARVTRPGGASDGEPIEFERGILIEQQYVGRMGGEGWGLHEILRTLNTWLPEHLRSIGAGLRDPAPDYSGLLVLDVYESFQPLFELAGTLHREAWRGAAWSSTTIPSATHFGVAEQYDQLALRLGIETIEAYRRRYPRARIGITTVPGAMFGTEWMADAHRGLVYSGRGTDRRAALNDRLRPILDACDFGVASCFLRARSDERAPSGLGGPAAVDAWWQRQELPADLTEAYLAGNCLEAARCFRGKPVYALVGGEYQGDPRGPHYGAPLSWDDLRRTLAVPASCGVAGWLFFASVGSMSARPLVQSAIDAAALAATQLWPAMAPEGAEGRA